MPVSDVTTGRGASLPRRVAEACRRRIRMFAVDSWRESVCGAATAAPACVRIAGALWRRGWGQRCTRAALVLAGALYATLAAAGPRIEHWTLANGGEVYLVESHGLPMLDVSIAFDGGSRRDPADKVGLADFAADLSDAGVAAGPDAAQEPALDENGLADAWADLGASFGAGAGRDQFGYSLRTLTEPDVLARAVALAARQIAHPAYPQAVLAREVERAAAGLRESLTRPEVVAGRAYARAVYQGHPYGALTTEAGLHAITVADLAAFHARTVLPCRAQVVMVGDVTRAAAGDIAARLLAQLPQPAACPALPAVPPVAPLAHPVDERIPFRSAQAQILVGQPGIARSDPDFLTLVVGNQILGGGGFSSRLMHEVREKRGLTYGVGSGFSPGADAGAFTISLQTRPDQADAALAIVRQVLADYVRTGPTAAELAEAKANLVGGFPLMLDSNAKLLAQVANIARNGLPLDYLDRWPGLIQAVTAAQIRQAFQRVLQPDRMVTVVLGAQPSAGTGAATQP